MEGAVYAGIVQQGDLLRGVENGAASGGGEGGDVANLITFTEIRTKHRKLSRFDENFLTNSLQQRVFGASFFLVPFSAYTKDTI
jgi:hypothetical protein